MGGENIKDNDSYAFSPYSFPPFNDHDDAFKEETHTKTE